MPAVKDPYKTLGVAKNASDDEIKKVYRKLARENHPDRNPNDKAAEERFKDIQGAYDILSDPEKRKAYDSGGGIFGGGAGGFDPAGERFDPAEHEALSTRDQDGAEPGVVLDVVEKGYRANGTVLRPARVVVSA